MNQAATRNRPEDVARERVLAEIEQLGLSARVNDLNSNGYTVVEGVLSEATVARAKAAILEVVKRREGKRVDAEHASESDQPGITYLGYLLYENEVFEEILLQPQALALVTYLLGESCLLSSLGCHFKGPGGAELPLHSDNGNGMPSPFPAYSQVANVNYALTPYSEQAGALALVPASHQLARQPTAAEMHLSGERRNRHALAMNLQPGDMVVWHGNTWHGSFQRQIPGVRMNLAVYFCRQYLQTQEQHRGVVPSSLQRRHAENARLLRLLGDKQPYGWRSEGPDYALMAQNPRGLHD